MRLLIILFLPLTLLAQSNKPRFNSSVATNFVNSLDSEQKKIALFSFTEGSRHEWHYVPPQMIHRYGIPIKDLNDAQKEKAYILLKEFLSESGYTKSKDIMSYEYLLKEMEPNNANRVPENYFISIYGDPAKDATWGWRLTGHHLTLNFTLVNNQLAFAPFFFGIYPATIPDGPMQGRRLLKMEEDLGFELVNSLTQEQKDKAIFRKEAYADIVTTNAIQAGPMTKVGIARKELTQPQRDLLEKLIMTYLSSMPTDIAKARMEKVLNEDPNEIYFGWAGGTTLTPAVGHYYRIQGKTFLVEFDNTQANANHIHTVWREFNGDFGEDLLREHYKNVKH